MFSLILIFILLSQKDLQSAKFHILEASQSPYGLRSVNTNSTSNFLSEKWKQVIFLKPSYFHRSDDYMAALAKVHCVCRNWTSSVWKIHQFVIANNHVWPNWNGDCSRRIIYLYYYYTTKLLASYHAQLLLIISTNVLHYFFIQNLFIIYWKLDLNFKHLEI